MQREWGVRKESEIMQQEYEIMRKYFDITYIFVY